LLIEFLLMFEASQFRSGIPDSLCRRFDCPARHRRLAFDCGQGVRCRLPALFGVCASIRCRGRDFVAAQQLHFDVR